LKPCPQSTKPPQPVMDCHGLKTPTITQSVTDCNALQMPTILPCKEQCEQGDKQSPCRSPLIHQTP
jgi:hypothetical protein